MKTTTKPKRVKPIALLACPFCGSAPQRMKTETELTTGWDQWWQIKCSFSGCSAKTNKWYPLSAAEKAWNNRKG